MLAHQSTLHHWTEPGGHSPSAKVLPPAQSPRRTVFKFEQKPAPSEVAVPVASTSPQCRCLLDELWGEMFEPLKDEALFATARQDGELGTVVWANGADFAPEFLLEAVQRQQRHAA